MTKRAVLYARVSRDDTRAEGRNLEGQIEMGEDYAHKRGYHIVAKLREDDKGASGAEINLPKLNEVREMAQGHQFDVLVVREIDRLSRSLAKQLIVEQELKRQGVDIEYVLGEYPDTPEGNFMRHIRATVAEYEREKINERVIRGRHSKIKAGSVFVSGHAPYGYHLVQTDSHSMLEVHEPEAAIVRMIFEWYLSGLSLRKIAERLHNTGVPTYSDLRPNTNAFPRRRETGSKWGRGAVRHILMNETYAGVWRYGKRDTVGRKGTKKRTDKEQFTVEVPAIVSRDIWEAAASMRERNRSERRHSSDYPYLLKGCIFCEHCGHRMGARTAHVNGKVYAYYRCSAHRHELVDECPYSSIYYPAELVDATVWHWITSLLTQPEQLRLGLEAYQAQKEQNIAPLRERLRLVEEMVTTEQAKLTRLLELYLSGEFPREMLTERKTHLEAKLSALENEKWELMAAVEGQAMSDEQVALIQQFGEEIAGELDSAAGDTELMRHVINLLGLQARLRDKDGERTVLVSCGIGEQLLPLTHTNTNGYARRRARRSCGCARRCSP